MLKEPGQSGFANTGSSRKILMAGKSTAFSEQALNHCLHLAERLKYDLVALHVDTKLEGSGFALRAADLERYLSAETDRRGVRSNQLVRSGDFEQAIEDTIQEIKRVELVVMDLDRSDEEVRGLTVPAVSIINSTIGKGGGMAARNESSRVRTLVRTAGYGALSAACYAVVFSNADAVMRSFTRGGWYAAFPIATVLGFSFVHGAFASNLWSLLGIEAFKKDRLRQTERKVIEKRKQLRKRPRLYAYVNPFHKMDV
ncbi:MAG: universal stress protein [Desulfobacteraceae bacterium]|nr:universal stress protein [Desulfobacteraceae bacterium]